jgi:predicted transcriptional regulator
MSIKGAAIEAVRQMPDEASYEDLLDKIETMAAIQRGLADADAGRFVSNDEVKRRIDSWFAK